MTSEPLRELLTAIADGRDVDAVELQRLWDADPASADLLEQVADRFTRLRRRDAQFAAVVAMTHDLVARRDGSLLESIVERAHELLGSDMTYISVYEHATGQLVVQAVKGESDPDFRGMVVPPGIGIATLVVQKMGPMWVDDYHHSDGFPRDTEIDRVVAREQISSILGVPLIADGTVLGVLFVADRRSRRYSPEEIALARSFADHAAIVIEQGRLVADLHAASHRAEHERRRAEQTATEIKTAAALHEELTGLVASGTDPETITAALAASLGRDIAVVDDDLDLLAGDAELTHGESERAAIRAAITDGASAVTDGAVEFVAPIVVRQSSVGAVLVSRTDEPLTRAGRRAVERSGIAFALMWMQRRASDLADERVRGELAQELIDGRGSRDAVLERVRARGLSPAQPWHVAHFALDDELAERALQALRASGDLVSASGGGLWALSERPELLERVSTALRRAGAGSPLIVHHRAASLDALLDEVESVRSTRALLSGMGVHTGSVDAVAFAPYTVLFDGRGDRAAAFVESTLRPLLDWDERRGTDLFATLAASLDEQGSVTGIARRLQVHANTVRQRLDRIGTLLPDDWAAPDARFRLEIAVRLETARRAIRT